MVHAAVARYTRGCHDNVWITAGGQQLSGPLGRIDEKLFRSAAWHVYVSEMALLNG
jgi:hypothetical protein